MALLQIAEPGASPVPHERRHAVGIDLGTTNSLVATVRSGNAEVIQNREGDFLLPSVVHYGQDHILVGTSAKEKASTDAFNTIASVKRFMGRGISDIKTLGDKLPYRFVEKESGGMPFLDTAAGLLSPVNISADILSVLAKQGAEAVGGELDGAVITVPAYFDEAQRQATKDAAQLAGINVLRLLNEPTAAAVAYGLDRQDEGVIAIYDLGGGTFDISILRLQAGVFEVLSTGGDTALGGDDFDRNIAEWMLASSTYEGELTPELSRTLLEQACQLKECLSTQESAQFEFNFQDHVWLGELSKNKFNELVEPLIRQTLKVCKRCLRDAGLKTADIGNVVMVGGSTRIPRVRSLVGELFAKEPLVSIDPDKVVAIGAAIQADVLVGNRSGEDMLLLDVNSLSLGIETMGGLVEKIIPRNATIPVARAQEFTTYKDGQTAMSLHVLQGERELVSDCRSLARFELRGIPSMVAGAARIQVTFQVDADGLLNVFAKELSTGIESSIQVKPSYGLAEEEITEMIKASIEHAKDDVQARQLREKQIDAQALLASVEGALEKDGEKLLTTDERNDVMAALEKLRQVAFGEDERSIVREVENTSKASDEFAARRMDASIKEALAGKSLDSLKLEEKE